MESATAPTAMRRPGPPGASAAPDRADGACGGGPTLCRRADIEHHDLVRALFFVERGASGGIARVAQVLEADALDDAAIADIKTGDHARGQHRVPPMASPA